MVLTMKTKIIASLVAIGLVATASADVLLWQVPDNSGITSATDVYGNPQVIGTDNYTWSYAMLQYTTSESIGPSDIAGKENSIAYDADSNPNAVATYWYGQNIGTKVGSGFGGETLSSDYNSTYNYYIGLYNSSGSLVGYSSILENVSQFTAASHNIADWAGVNVANGGSSGWTAAPEPTSGVLLLLGAAVLGLRRRKVA